jgi:UDP-N-acetylglucosamine/UDP-N-acetyl-alpha-D-glucosaminouronate 4-epimerase
MSETLRALVTGGAGFIGSHVVDALLGRGYAVRVVDDLSTGRLENLRHAADKIEFVEGDVRNPAVCTRTTRDIDVVFHLAALASVARSMEAPLQSHEVNASGTLHLLEASRQNGVRRLVFSSSSSVYGDTAVLPKREDVELEPRSPYAVSKLAGEQYVLAYARAGMLEGVALRYFNIFGPRQDPAGPYAAVVPVLMQAALDGTPFAIFGDGEQTRDFTFVQNAVRANLLAVEGDSARCNGVVVNVGNGARTSLTGLVQMVERVSGRRIPITFAPPRAGDVRDSLADLSRARAALQYEPTVGLAEGLATTWKEFAGPR